MEILRNDFLSLEIEPGLGGKIASLIDLRSGRNWLARHPRLPWKPVEETKRNDPNAYIERADLGGWDECCPTVGTCRYPLHPFKGIFLPDHGECWYQEPLMRKEALEIFFRWQGKTLPFELERRVRLEANEPKAYFEYNLRSVSEIPFSVLWSAHPIFVIHENMRLFLPAGTRFEVCSEGSPLGRIGTFFSWPLCNDLDLSRIDPLAGWAVKLFSEPMESGNIRLLASDGNSLQIAWGKNNPGLRAGLWLNYGGWSGDGGEKLRNLGIEPCLGMPDALDQAVSRNEALVLAPFQELAWTLEITYS